MKMMFNKFSYWKISFTNFLKKLDNRKKIT